MVREEAVREETVVRQETVTQHEVIREDEAYPFAIDVAHESDGERAFLRATKHFASGVTVVTTRTATGLYGVTVSSFTFVSRDPRLVFVSLASTSSLLPKIEESRLFAINVLPSEGRHLADRFAKRGAVVDPAFTGIRHRSVTTGAPVLADALAWFDCRLFASYQAGDHQMIVGESLAVGERAGDPLLYYRGQYGALAK